MNDKETLINLFIGISQNIAFNLDFIPADKLTWKPAPTANSALEIVGHVVQSLGALSAPDSSSLEVPTDLAQAKQQLQKATDRFVQTWREASPQQLEQPSALGLTMGRFAVILVVDTINHHGQITYIQTLLGDTESHFAPEVLDYMV